MTWVINQLALFSGLSLFRPLVPSLCRCLSAPSPALPLSPPPAPEYFKVEISLQLLQCLFASKLSLPFACPGFFRVWRFLLLLLAHAKRPTLLNAGQLQPSTFCRLGEKTELSKKSGRCLSSSSSQHGAQHPFLFKAFFISPPPEKQKGALFTLFSADRALQPTA